MTGAGAREHRECEPEPCLLKGQSVGRGLLRKGRGAVDHIKEREKGHSLGRGDPEEPPLQILSLEAPTSGPQLG